MPRRRCVGTLLEAHQHLHLSAERVAIEIDRLLAAAAERQVGLDDIFLSFSFFTFSPVRQLWA